MGPLFSIITVTYNAAPVLERTISSVESQDYPDIEYIIVDGLSADATADIIRAHAERVDKLVREADSGLYDAMNKGIRQASGDYLIFLNAGDTFHDERTLSSVAASLGDSRPDVIYGQTAIVGPDGRFLRMRDKSAPEELDRDSFRMGMVVCHQAFWASAALSKENPYDLRYRFSSDVDWCIRILKRSRSNHCAGIILIDYLEGGMTERNRFRSLMERFRVMTEHYGLLRTLGSHIGFLWSAVIKKRG